MNTKTEQEYAMGAGLSSLALLAGEAAQLVERVQASVVWVQSGHGHGSGLVWEPGGWIVTNHHVVSGDRARVELSDGRHLEAWVVGRDMHNDLAVLEAPVDGLTPAPIGNSAVLRVGELIIAVGHPFGVKGTATLGIVSRACTAPNGNGERRREQRELLQADVDLAPGNSGGPLVNAAGEVVGIASMVVGPGVALAVPSHVVRHFVAALSTARTGRDPGEAEWLGRGRRAA